MNPLSHMIRRVSGDDRLITRLFSKGLADLWVKGIGLFGILAMNAVLARYLGVEAFGHFAFVLSGVTLLSLVARLGMDSGALRFVPIYVAQEDWGLLNGVLQWMAVRVVAASMLLAMAVAGGAFLFRSLLDPGLLSTLLWGAVLLPLLSLTLFLSFALRGRLWVVRAQLPDHVTRPLGTILVVVIAGLAGWSMSGADAMAALACATFVALLQTALWLRRSLPEPARNVVPRQDPEEWWRRSLPLLFVAGANMLLNQTDILMLGFLQSTDASGLYAVASRIAAVTIFAVIALGSIGQPMIAELYALDKRAELQKLARVIARVSLATMVPMVLFFALAGELLLGFFGVEFEAAYWPLLILVLGQAIASLFGASGYLLTMTDQQGYAAKCLALSVGANLVLNLTLIPVLGMNGAALATAVATVMNLALMAWGVYRKIRIRPTAF